MVQNLQDAVGPNNFGELVPKLEVKALNSDLGKSKIDRVFLAGIQMIGIAPERVVCRIVVVVLAHKKKVIMGVAYPGFIYPSGIRCPGPARRACLRPLVLAQRPFWRHLDWGRVKK